MNRVIESVCIDNGFKEEEVQLCNVPKEVLNKIKHDVKNNSFGIGITLMQKENKLFKIRYFQNCTDNEIEETLKELEILEKLTTFGVALEHIKNGGKAKRYSWNGKDQYIYISNKVILEDYDGKEYVAENDMFGGRVVVFVNPKLGQRVGWLCSQADMLSDDWILI